MLDHSLARGDILLVNGSGNWYNLAIGSSLKVPVATGSGDLTYDYPTLNAGAPGAAGKILISDAATTEQWRTVPDTDARGTCLGFDQGANDWTTQVILALDTDCSGYTQEGRACWNTSANTLYIGDGSAPVLIGPPPICVSYVMYSPCALDAAAGCSVTGDGCVALTNIGAVGQRGPTIQIDFDIFTYCKLRYTGSTTGAQTGTVTVKLRNYSTSADDITTSFSSDTSCASRSSSATDLSSNSGLDSVGVQVGDSVANDDPSLSGVVLECCNQTFTW